MTHRFDGFSATFTHRGSWKANLYRGNEFLGVVPVTWTKGNYRDPVTKEVFQRVWYSDPVELASARESREPFLVIVALADDYKTQPHSVKHMNAVYRLVSTGESREDQSIECKVLDRIRADR
jgi:hypothetical protein